MNEVWKAVPEASKYAISNLGRVKNLQTGKVLTQYVIGRTPTVSMQLAGKAICRSVPKLVKELF